MKLVAPSDISLSRRLTIASGPIDGGSKIGGKPPRGLTSPLLSSEAQYVLTVVLALEPLLYATLFTNSSPEDRFEALNGGPKRDERIFLVAHLELPFSEAPEQRSALSEHPLIVGSGAPDVVPDEEGGMVVDSHHKIGGRPFCIQEPELPESEELFANGYIHVLQLDFPGPPDALVKGEWPFGGGLFNLFWRPPFSEQDCVWYLQG